MSEEKNVTVRRRISDSEKKRRIFNILLIAGAVLIIVIAVIMILNATGHGFGNKNAVSAPPTEAGVDVIPYGDPASDSYDYTGDYFDMSTQKGTMTIARQGSGYEISVTYADSDDTMTTWGMTAVYDKARKALYYYDCTKTDYVFTETPTDSEQVAAAEDAIEEATGEAVELPKTETQSSVDQSTAYTDGTGYIYMSSENFYWIDDKEDMGNGLLFQKVEAPAE